ncbi:stabilizer of axonemal microtubules 3 isoform X3 [Pyxicephalus adspersus]|uniref:stabilizer of axonemal microtubules 3 isoform X3 n=1 Tax=Pyxicephalus adspersus TaxID=30357 RepID=UPI003B5CB153
MGLERRQDWHLTSTGIGHNYRAQVPFPPPHIKSTLSEPLPATLLQGNEVTAFDELLNTYETTTGSTYNRKYPGGALSQPNHPLPPPHWKVNYNKDLWEKSIVATTENKGLSRDPYYIRDGGVLSLNDIYASTTMRDFRTFTAKELESYPKKDILTYWQAEDYPKVWGHGLKENPLSKESQPTLRRPPPMRDSMQFPTATKLPRIPPRARSVPHRGLKTLAQESYQQPLDAKRSHDVYFPLECPWTMPHTGPLPEIMSVPKMYETEYETYGSKQPVTV